jgi:hypothetical protein
MGRGEGGGDTVLLLFNLSALDGVGRLRLVPVAYSQYVHVRGNGRRSYA